MPEETTETTEPETPTEAPKAQILVDKNGGVFLSAATIQALDKAFVVIRDQIAALTAKVDALAAKPKRGRKPKAEAQAGE